MSAKCVKIGRPYFNRVALKQKGPGKVICMCWREDGKRFQQSLRHSNWQKAQEQAWVKVEEWGAQKRASTHLPTDRLLAVKADLRRVAALNNMPDGYAPSRRMYAKDGDYAESTVRAAFRGYEHIAGSTNAKDSWGEAIRKYGLKVAGTLVRGVTFADAAADVRRVAKETGHPHRMPTNGEYKRLGRWNRTTIVTHLRAKNWGDVARTLQLEYEPNREATARRLSNVWQPRFKEAA